jgi:hypothetical protein
MAHGKDVLDGLKGPPRALRTQHPSVFEAYGAMERPSWSTGRSTPRPRLDADEGEDERQAR